MRWTKLTMSLLLAFSVAFAGCSELADNPTAPSSDADKKPPQPYGDISQLWVQHLISGYASISDWYTVPVSLDGYNPDTMTCLARHSSWPLNARLVIQVTDGDYTLLEGVRIKFPTGTEPFFASATYYKVNVPEGLSVTVYMPPDPMRYGPEVVGYQFSKFGVSISSLLFIATLPTETNPYLAPFYRHEVGATYMFPDTGSVIVPPQLIPAEDGDD